MNSSSNVSEKIKWLSRGPSKEVISYSGYIVNGCRFRTKASEKATQNSGVSLDASTIDESNNSSYYGVLRNIYVLDYKMFHVPVFECAWANMDKGVKVEDGFTLVNLHQFQNQYQRDPFIFASQASQVFYSRENNSSNWYTVVRPPPKGFHELEVYDEDEGTSFTPLDISNLDTAIDDEDDSYVRKDCNGILVDR